MGCFPCSRDSSSSSSSNNRKYNNNNNIPNKNRNNRRDDHAQPPPSDRQKVNPVRNEPNPASSATAEQVPSEDGGPIDSVKARTFSLAELVSATESFKDDNFLGEGGFGRVYKGRISTGEIVAIKKLDRSGGQGISEFVVEVITLSSAHHNNLVKLIGFCAEGDQRLLVYEYMPLGALDDHIHEPGPEKGVMDWNTRMKIAAGAAKGLEYLHTKMTPAIIYRDLKCSNILLGPEYHPKLSDFGLAKVGPQGDATHVSTRVMGTYGYCAPEYAMTGQLTYKSDLFSFGVVLLELITGRRAIDNRRPKPEQNLVAWARPLFKDRKKFQSMVDPALKGQYPVRGLYQALAIAAMCVQEQPSVRPNTADIVTALTYLASQIYDPNDIVTPRSSPSSSASTSRRISRTPGEQKSEEGKSNGEEVEQNSEEGKANGDKKAEEGDQNPEEGEAKREEVEQKPEEGEKQFEECEKQSEKGEQKAEEDESTKSK